MTRTRDRICTAQGDSDRLNKKISDFGNAMAWNITELALAKGDIHVFNCQHNHLRVIVSPEGIRAPEIL